MIPVVKKLLLVDDNQEIKSIYATMFKGEGFDVTAVSDGQEAWELIQQGNLSVVLLAILVFFSTLVFLTKKKSLLKGGAVSHMTASVLFILTMIRLMPGTFTLTFQIISPIIASLILLIGNVVVLLLWQQLQLKTKKK